MASYTCPTMTEPQTHPHVREHTVVVPADVPMVEFVQGPKSYHPAMQELER